MPGIIEALQHLQKIELKLAEMRHEENAKQRRINKHRKDLDAVEARIRDLDQQILQAKAYFDSIELEVKSREEVIAKHREALNQTKTNKDYAAILTTINTEKADASKFETQGLEIMARIDQLNAARQQVEQEREVTAQRLAKVEEALQAYRDKTRNQRTQLETERREAAQDLPDLTLKTFDRVAQHHDGEAMAPVARINPRREDYCCGGCNMKVTLEIVSALGAVGDIQFCASCGRILYLDKD